MNEEGNSFLMFIFLMPVLCGAFGLGLDGALGNYTRTGLQDAADIASIAGANKTVYSGNKRIIDKAAADATVRALYNEKRTAYPNVLNKTPTITVSIIPGRPGSPSVLQVTVQEKSPTVFLHLVGVPEFTYNIRSQARLGYVSE